MQNLLQLRIESSVISTPFIAAIDQFKTIEFDKRFAII